MAMNLHSRTSALILCSLLLATPPAVAQVFDNTEELAALQQEMGIAAEELRANIDAAIEDMRQIESVDASEQAVFVNQYFDSIEEEARSVLTLVSRNSEFADQVLMMRSNISALIATLEAEDVTPTRDRNLARLTVAQDEYNVVMQQIADAEQQIVQAIVTNNTTRSDALRDIQIGAVEDAVGRLQEVAEGLVAMASVMEAISSVAIDNPGGAIAQQ